MTRRAFYLAGVVMLVGLSSLPGCVPEANPPAVTLAPPAWIQGTWLDALEISSWTFTPDNAIWHMGERPGNPSETTIDYRDQYEAVGITDSASGDRWPTYKLISHTGSTIVTFILYTEEEDLLGIEHLSADAGYGDPILYYRDH